MLWPRNYRELDRPSKRHALDIMAQVPDLVREHLFYLEEFIPATSLIERVLNSGHDAQNFFFLQSLPHDLDRYWETMHLLSVIVCICAFCDSVELSI